MWVSLLVCRPFICISSDRLRFGHLWRHIHLRTQHWMVIADFSSRLSRRFSSSCLTTSLSQTTKYTLGDYTLEYFYEREKQLQYDILKFPVFVVFKRSKEKTSTALIKKKAIFFPMSWRLEGNNGVCHLALNSRYRDKGNPMFRLQNHYQRDDDKLTSVYKIT